MEKIPYTRPLSAVSDDAVQFFMMTEPIPSSMWLMVQHTVEEDEDNDFDRVRVGYGESIANVRWWEEHLECIAARLYWQDKEIHFVPEMNRVIFRFDGTTLGDRLNCLVEGYTFEKVLSAKKFRSRKRE